MYEIKTLQANELFHRMLQSCWKQGKGDPTLYLEKVLVSFDPGETTGLCYRLPWEDGFKIHMMQLSTKEIGPACDHIVIITQEFGQTLQHWVCEDYKVYSWKADTHKWAGLHTPQLIGAIRLLAYQRKVPLHFQMAQEGKSWATDQKLQSWGLYDPGMRHARDASRHLITRTFFGKADGAGEV